MHAATSSTVGRVCFILCAISVTSSFNYRSKTKHILSDHNQCLIIAIYPNALKLSFIRTKQQQSHDILKKKEHS